MNNQNAKISSERNLLSRVALHNVRLVSCLFFYDFFKNCGTYKATARFGVIYVEGEITEFGEFASNPFHPSRVDNTYEYKYVLESASH